MIRVMVVISPIGSLDLRASTCWKTASKGAIKTIALHFLMNILSGNNYMLPINRIRMCFLYYFSLLMVFC